MKYLIVFLLLSFSFIAMSNTANSTDSPESRESTELELLYELVDEMDAVLQNLVADVIHDRKTITVHLEMDEYSHSTQQLKEHLQRIDDIHKSVNRITNVHITSLRNAITGEDAAIAMFDYLTETEILITKLNDCVDYYSWLSSEEQKYLAKHNLLSYCLKSTEK